MATGRKLEALRETVAILSDPQAASDIREGIADILAGRVTNAEDIRDSMLARHTDEYEDEDERRRYEK